MPTPESHNPFRRARVHWVHPRLGEVIETACVEHREDLRAALRTLGQTGVIAYLGENTGEPCWRCQHFIDELPAHEVLNRLQDLMTVREVEDYLRRQAG